MAFFKRKRRITFAEIEKRMPAAALAALQKEAEFLRTAHGVSVRELAPGEEPKEPQAADGTPIPPRAAPRALQDADRDNPAPAS